LQHATKDGHLCLNAVKGLAGEGIDDHSSEYKPLGDSLVRNFSTNCWGKFRQKY
jgi:hypothetical protein